MVCVERFLARFHTASFIVLFGGLLIALAVTVLHALTGRVDALSVDMLIGFTLGALLCVLIGTVGPRHRG